MKNNNFYITTTLPYVNADPHIGHAIEFMQADALARYYRKQLGTDHVFFNVGTDEHGLKMFQKAQEAGLDVKAFVSRYAERFKQFCAIFNVNYDFFYRTSEQYHYGPAQEFWKRCEANGDIYKKDYTGKYCVGCEAFKTEKELVNGKCPEHDKEPIDFAETNYFFKLSKYRQNIVDYIDANKDFIYPAHKAQELRNFVEQLEDISISRLKENLPWGIPVPNDDEQVFYVWFDALTNYVNVVGFGTDEEKLKQWWPGVQLCGPDNLRFQGGIWQGMLASAGLAHTKNILVHGTMLGPDGRKMSKTLGNVVSPYDLADQFGYTAVRYYLLAGIPTFADAAYNEQELINRYNSELADQFGNLLSRVVHLAEKKEAKINDYASVDKEFKQQIDALVQQYHEKFVDFNIAESLAIAGQVSSLGNKYIDQYKPWTLDNEAAQPILNNLSYLLDQLCDLYYPAVPEQAEQGKQALHNLEKIVLFPKWQ